MTEPAPGPVGNISTTGARKRSVMGIWLSLAGASGLLWMLVTQAAAQWLLVVLPLCWLGQLCLYQVNAGT